jgi:ATP-dependent Clp protease ATP-binding subunit ClpA
MEYFQGLLFLTTNRIGQIDDAFLSRVHVVIGYTPLDEAKRKRIWDGFFRNLERDMAAPSRDGPKIEVSKYAKEYVLNDEEVKALKWNGREIRNAFQTAISLAGYEAAKNPDWTTDKTIDVQKDHFSSVVMMSREFHSYMDSITLQEESQRARARMERNDEHMLG